jgi:hypothetical protein
VLLDREVVYQAAAFPVRVLRSAPRLVLAPGCPRQARMTFVLDIWEGARKIEKYLCISLHIYSS